MVDLCGIRAQDGRDIEGPRDGENRPGTMADTDDAVPAMATIARSPALAVLPVSQREGDT